MPAAKSAGGRLGGRERRRVVEWKKGNAGDKNGDACFAGAMRTHKRRGAGPGEGGICRNYWYLLRTATTLALVNGRTGL